MTRTSSTFRAFSPLNTKSMMTAYICTNKVTHARLLPEEAKHQFTYPTVSFLLPLSALERGDLDLGGGWLFGYGSLWPRICGLRASAYLQTQRAMSIKQKLVAVLESYGLNPEDFGDAWMLTMPSYFGFEGINPLTVYFCYKHDRFLWVVILEVHNTFGERHIYVLPVGPEHQDPHPQSSYSHSWTFPRQFHVSPFNDRSGYYRCSIVPPPCSPIVCESEECASETLSNIGKGPTVLIDLYTSDPRHTDDLVNPKKKEKQRRTKKLIAVLRPTSCRTFTSKNLVLTLLEFPCSLFLSFPRIAYEAARLHYSKKLPVYARPAPRASDVSIEENLTIPRNPVEQDQKRARPQGGGVGWQPETMLENYARRRVEDFLHARAQETEIKVELIFADPSFGTRTFANDTQTSTKDSETLSIFVRCPQAFVSLFISPTPQHAYALGQESEHQFTVSDATLFTRFFTLQQPLPVSLAGRLSQWIRFSALPPALRLKSTAMSQSHFLAHPQTTQTKSAVKDVFALLLFYTLLYVERLVFAITRARFVDGDEPWNIWIRTLPFVS